jgi:uncharacterized protein with NRDE domain
MCLLALVLNSPLSPLSVIHLRDERSDRKAAPPCSHQRVLGGTDGAIGDGAWFAFGRDTRVVAALTNVRAGTGGSDVKGVMSRGSLVAAVARGQGSVTIDACAAAAAVVVVVGSGSSSKNRKTLDLGASYGAFNLVVARLAEGDTRAVAFHVTNVYWIDGEAFWVGGDENFGRWAYVSQLSDGVHVVSNGAMDVEEGWPKVTLLSARVRVAAESTCLDTEGAMQLLAAALLNQHDVTTTIITSIKDAAAIGNEEIGEICTSQSESHHHSPHPQACIPGGATIISAAAAAAAAGSVEEEVRIPERRLGPSPVAQHIETALRASIFVPHEVARKGFLSRVATALVFPIQGPALFAWADVAAAHYNENTNSSSCCGGWGALRVCKDCLQGVGADVGVGVGVGAGAGREGVNWKTDGIEWFGCLAGGFVYT